MYTIENLKDDLPTIIALLKQHGFSRAILFKGFGESELHNLNLLVIDTSQKQFEKKIAERFCDLVDDLQEAINCKICLTAEYKMKPHYLAELDETNSVNLDVERSIQHELISTLDRVFGDDWEFTSEIKKETFVPFYATSPSNARQAGKTDIQISENNNTSTLSSMIKTH